MAWTNHECSGYFGFACITDSFVQFDGFQPCNR